MNASVVAGNGWRGFFRVAAAAVFLIGSGQAQAILNGAADLSEVAESSAPAAPHAENTNVFDDAFEAGNELFDTSFNALDGVGANVGSGQRFTRVPRADLTNAAAQWWNSHTPRRITGPNADACAGCHEQALESENVKLFVGNDALFKTANGTPITETSGDDGSGRSENDAVRDPNFTATLNQFIERNAPHLFGIGGVQRVAEEITADLQADKNTAITNACNSAVGTTVTRNLCSENRARKLDNNLESVCYGSISATRVATGGSACPNNSNRFTLNTSNVQGVNTDLVIRPFQWKGSVAFIRDFVRGAAHNELGMQGVEITGDDFDGDGDGVANELTIDDMTALSVYQAGQPRPVSILDLDDEGLISPALSQGKKDAINRGNSVFNNLGCANCHKFQLLVNAPTFSEPSLSSSYRDNGTFPAGQAVIAPGFIQFDLTQDLPDNQLFDIIFGIHVADLGNFEKQNNIFLPGFGKTLVKLRGDLKRHNMGTNLVEPIQDGSPNIPAGTWLTENLWGAGSSAPYLHDGRATTFAEAILEHTCTLNQTLPGRPGTICTDRGEAAASVDAFRALNAQDRADLEAALQSQVLFKVEAE